MNRKGIQADRFLDVLLDSHSGQGVDPLRTLFCNRTVEFDPGFIYRKMPMSQAQEAFQLYKTPGLVKGKILLMNED